MNKSAKNGESSRIKCKKATEVDTPSLQEQIVVQDELMAVDNNEGVTSIFGRPDGIDISMDVTENFPSEGEDEFPEGGELEDELVEQPNQEDDDDEIQFTDRNNNATGVALNQAGCSGMQSAEQGGEPMDKSKQVGAKDMMDEEERHFMERFAVFMERRGFIQRAGNDQARNSRKEAPGNCNPEAARRGGANEGETKESAR